jgi:uncharacterized membrane protein
VALLLLIVVFADRPLRPLQRSVPRAGNNLNPKGIVKERYARGEIDHEPYERMMQHLA